MNIFHFFIFFYFQDNDHGQQGNGSITVNRRPTLVQGIDGIKITRVACGSSHSVAWTAPEPPSVAPPEPVPFPTVKDPLGSTAAGKIHHLKRFYNISCFYILEICLQV